MLIYVKPHVKLTSALLIVLLIGLGAWALDRWSVLPILPVDPVDYVPADAAVVAVLPRMDLALQLIIEEQGSAWEKAVQQLPGLSDDVNLINSLIDTLFPSRTLLDQARGLLSIDALNDRQLAGTWILDLRSLGKLNPEDWLKNKGLRYQSSSFRGNPVWTAKLADGRQIALGAVRNLLILARLPYQVEAVLAADRKADNWLEELGTTAASTAVFSLYWNVSRWGDVQKVLFTSGGQQLTQHWTDWLYSARLDLLAEQGAYRIEGRSIAPPGKRFHADRSAAPLESDLWGLLPNNTAALKAVNLADYEDYFRHTPRRQVGRFQRFFLPWLSGPAFELTLRPFNAQVNDRQICFLHFSDQNMVMAALNDWMTEVGILQTAHYQGFTMTQVQEDQNLFPWSDNIGKNPWWTMVGQYLLLSTNRTALENWIDHYAVGNALPLTEVARQMTLSDTGGQFSFFLDWKQWRSGWRHLVKDNALANALSGLGQLALRVHSKGEFGEINGLWKLEEAPQVEGDLNWRIVLADEVTAGPWIGYDASGKPMITVQDQAHRLYSLDGAGKKIWQQPLNGRILSIVKTIDLKEGPALTFNTADAIYMVDLNGKAIEPFPLRLRNPTDQAFTLIDFSADKNYNFFVTASDGCVYGYDLDGGPVPGWNPKCQLGKIQQPLLHFQDENRDFLVLRNSNGVMRAFARDGSVRLDADFPAHRQAAMPQVQLLNGPKQIVSCTDSGIVEVLSLDGAAMQFRLPVGDNLGVDMVYENFLGDGRKDYLLAAGRHLNLHAYTGKGLEKQFEREFPLEIDDFFPVTLPGAGEDPYIGVLLRGNRRIYLLDQAGETLPGFPLAGSTPFYVTDLFHNGEKHLIVGYQDELLAYRLP